MLLSAFTTPVLTPILSFMVFALIARSQPDSTLSVAVGFTSLSLFYLFMGPLNALLASVPNIAAALACCDRIQEYLLLETKADPRIYDEYSGSTDGSPLQSISNRTENGSEKSGLTQVSRASESIMVVHNGSIGWAETLLQEVNFQIQRGAFVAITGPTGSGKSTLLKGLLGELPFLGEPLHVTSLGVAYCDQTAWLPNETVQKSILGISDFDAQWYKSVIHACALEKDIEQWPQGDQLAAVGSKGATLSGGQKQRLVGLPTYLFIFH
jgi:ATP-binding cassette subfamily C (CFTR/MRP) protein 1